MPLVLIPLFQNLNSLPDLLMRLDCLGMSPDTKSTMERASNEPQEQAVGGRIANTLENCEISNSRIKLLARYHRQMSGVRLWTTDLC